MSNDNVITFKGKQKPVSENPPLAPATEAPHRYLIKMMDPTEDSGVAEFEVEGYLLCTGVWTAVMTREQNIIFSCPSARVVWCQDLDAIDEVEVELDDNDDSEAE